MESESLRRAVHAVAVMGAVLIAAAGFAWSRRRAHAGSHGAGKRIKGGASGDEFDSADAAAQARGRTSEDTVECVPPQRGPWCDFGGNGHLPHV